MLLIMHYMWHQCVTCMPFVSGSFFIVLFVFVASIAEIAGIWIFLITGFAI